MNAQDMGALERAARLEELGLVVRSAELHVQAEQIRSFVGRRRQPGDAAPRARRRGR